MIMPRRNYSGSVKVDKVIGVRNPQYDEDNVASETEELHARVLGREYVHQIIPDSNPMNECASLPGRMSLTKAQMRKARDQLR